MEIWKDLILRESDEEVNLVLKRKYSVSSYGRVYNKETNKFISHVITGKPSYWYVNLRVGSNKVILRRVHNIMAHTFLGEPPSSKYTCDHIDQNKYNNSLDNLRWLNKKGQMRNRATNLITSEGRTLPELLEDSKFENLDYQVLWKVYTSGFTSEPALLTEAKRLSLYGHLLWNSFVDFKSKSIRLIDFTEAFGLDAKEVQQLYNKGFKLDEILEGRTQHLLSEVPYNNGNLIDVEYKGVWYPDYREVLKLKDIPLTRWKDMKFKPEYFEDRLAEYYIQKEKADTRYKTLIDGFLMTIEEHCKRLGVSVSRIKTLMSRKGLSLEEALKHKRQRITRHVINGEVKKNKEWFEYFDIDPILGNCYLCRHRDFRKALEYYGVDTSLMDINPYVM